MQCNTSHLRYCAISRLLIQTSDYSGLVEFCLKLAFMLEGEHFFSGSAREILQRRFGVSVGAYSYGACFTPGQFQRNTVVGRYVSIAPGVRTFVRDHPLSTLSTHPFFYNSRLGIIKECTIPFGHLTIDHDAWLGYNAVITPGCNRIGIGAVVAAGAVVTKDVDDFAIVGGVPAKLMRYRFNENLRHEILESKWWELTPGQLMQFTPQLLQAIDNASRHHPLLKAIASSH